MANPRYFEYALMIDKFGSFKRASLELHVSQPALSKGIAALEEEYGVVIFNRNSRPLIATKSGKVILEEAQRIIQGDQQLKARLMQMKGMVNHKVRIGWGPYACKVYGADFAGRFKKRFPKSELFLVGGSWDDLPRLLRSRQIDLFVGDISEEKLRDEFDTVELPSEPVAFVCNPEHPLAEKNKVGISQIFSYPFVLCSAPPWAKGWFKKYMKGFDPRESPASIRVDDYRMIADILSKNPTMGTLGTLSCFRDELSAKKLTLIPIENSPAVCAGVATLKKTKSTSILDEVVSILEKLGEATAQKNRST